MVDRLEPSDDDLAVLASTESHRLLDRVDGAGLHARSADTLDRFEEDTLAQLAQAGLSRCGPPSTAGLTCTSPSTAAPARSRVDARSTCPLRRRRSRATGPNSGLAYRTLASVSTTWRDTQDLQTEAA